MKLSYLIKVLRPKINDIRNFKAFVIRANPKKEDDFSELAIKDVLLDEDGDEINIVLYDDASNENKHETLSVSQLLFKLEEFMPKASNYHLFVSHPVIDLDKKYYARLDVPIVGHGFSEKSSSLGLFEQEPKKENT